VNTEYIKSFLVLAKELHFWNAAAKLNLPQSTLTRRIKILEEELNVQLFERNKRNVSLTLAGSLLLEKWSDIMEQLDLLHAYASKMNNSDIGTISIGYPGSVTYTLLPDILTSIAVMYPLVRIKLVEMMYKNTEEYLLNFKVDIALSRDIPNSSALNYRRLGSDHFAVVVPEKHSFKVVDDLKSADWSKEKFILPPLDDGSNHVQTLHEILNFYGITPNTFYESDFGNTIISLVSKGVGISILPSSYSKSIVSNVRFIKLPFETTLHVIWRESDHSKQIRKIVNGLGAYFHL